MDITNVTITFNANIVDIWDKLSIKERYALMERELTKFTNGEEQLKFARQCLIIIKRQYDV